MNAEIPPPVTAEIREGIAVLTLSGPEGNALTPPLRAALAAELARALEDDAVRAVLLCGAGRSFSAEPGLETAAELDAAPALADLCLLVEEAGKPVVAGLHGTVAGPGLELALAAHARAADPGALLMLPGLAWGLPPAGGASQRLPRLAGAAFAFDMLLDARIASAEEARAAGLVDRVTAGAREAAFLALAGELADAPPPRPRDAGLADPAGYLAEVQRRRAALAAADSPAAPVLVRLVEAALMLPFEAGLEMERAAFADALAAPGTAGLMHVARIEQRPPAAGAAARRLDSAAVLGADDGATLAAQLLGQGLPVRLIDPDGALLEARGRAIATALERGGDDASRLVLSTGLEACAEADLVVVAGRGEIAAEYLSLAGLTAKSGAVIAAFGTDAEPAPVTGRPDDTVWLHWPMQPGTRRHAALAGGGPGARAAVAGLVRRFGRYPVEAAPPPARPALALQATLLRVIERLLLKGAGPGEIDAALARAGWASGPCAMLDAQGLAAAAAEAEAAAAAGWAPEPLGVAATLAEAGLEGKAAGQGLFLYDADGRACGTSAALERAVAGAREAAPEGPEIVERVLAALALCGLRLVRDGAVATAADVDLVALHVLAMPRDWGGPMGAAQSRGLLWLRGALRHFGEDDPDLWEKPAEIDRMIRDKIPLSSDL